MKDEQALKIIKDEAVRHAALANALNTVYRKVTGEDAITENTGGKLRPLPVAAQNLGLGAVYRTGGGKDQ